MSTVVDVRYVRWYVRYTFASYECIAYYSHILKRLSSCEWLCSLTALVELIDPVVFPLFKGPVFVQWLAMVLRRCGGFWVKTKRRSINTSLLFWEEGLLLIGVAMTPSRGEGLPACVGLCAAFSAWFYFGSGCYTMYSSERRKPMVFYSSLLWRLILVGAAAIIGASFGESFKGYFTKSGEPSFNCTSDLRTFSWPFFGRSRRLLSVSEYSPRVEEVARFFGGEAVPILKDRMNSCWALDRGFV